MSFFRLFLYLFALLAVPNMAQAAPAQDWTRTITLSAIGGHIEGNPAASTKLIEYVSYTCPHCAHFVAEGAGPLAAGWVRPGLISVEIRNLVRDRYDLTAAILARCGGPARFPGNHAAIFASQAAWVQKIMAYEKAPSTLPAKATQIMVMNDIANRTGLIALMAKRGVTPARSRQCLADTKVQAAVLAMTKQAIEVDRATGTPAFMLNGAMTGAHDWGNLKPLLPKPASFASLLPAPRN